MGPVSVMRRAGRLALVLLLVAVLAAVGVSGVVAVPVVAGAGLGVPDADVAAGGAPVDALAPTRAAGRPVAEPSVLRLHGPGCGGFFPIVPPGVLRAGLAAVGGRAAGASAALGAVLQGMAGVRGPPDASVRGTNILTWR